MKTLLNKTEDYTEDFIRCDARDNPEEKHRYDDVFFIILFLHMMAMAWLMVYIGDFQ